MLAPSSELLRAGVGLKLNQIKRATRSYLRDRTNQATGTVTSYAVAAGLFAAAGIFLIAACLVGADALFRWVEIHYGLFQAFGAVGALLVLIAAVCAGLAVMKLKRPPPRFPSLTSRLRVAIKANPIKSGQIEDARETARANPAAPMARKRAMRPRSAGIDGNIQASLAVAGLLLGWVAARRRQQARRMGASNVPRSI